MKTSPKIIAIIPARGGSKGVPRKNIRELGGKPLIAWTIEAALASRYISEVVVSTDSSEIAQISSSFGLTFPGYRSDEFSGDHASTVGAVRFTLNQMEDLKGENWDFIVILQPTSPLRTSTNIDDAIKLLIKREAQSLASFCRVSSNPEWMVVRSREGFFQSYLTSSVAPNRRQDLATIFEYNGAIYIASSKMLKQGIIEDSETLFYEMSFEESVDIDHEIDFDLASLILRRKLRNEH